MSHFVLGYLFKNEEERIQRDVAEQSASGNISNSYFIVPRISKTGKTLRTDVKHERQNYAIKIGQNTRGKFSLEEIRDSFKVGKVSENACGFFSQAGIFGLICQSKSRKATLLEGDNILEPTLNYGLNDTEITRFLSRSSVGIHCFIF